MGGKQESKTWSYPTSTPPPTSVLMKVLILRARWKQNSIDQVEYSRLRVNGGFGKARDIITVTGVCRSVRWWQVHSRFLVAYTHFGSLLAEECYFVPESKLKIKGQSLKTIYNVFSGTLVRWTPQIAAHLLRNLNLRPYRFSYNSFQNLLCFLITDILSKQPSFLLTRSRCS